MQKINANAYGLKAIPFLILCLQLIACANATNLRTPLLPYECEAEGQLLHTESNCNSKGILIYSKTGKDPPELCYKIKSCGEKFLTPVSGGWSCLDNCGKCPDWAAGCSHTNNYVIYEQAKLNSIASPEIIEPDDDISILLPTIELFNGNIHHVQQLQIRTIDVFDKDEVCICYVRDLCVYVLTKNNKIRQYLTTVLYLQSIYNKANNRNMARCRICGDRIE
nr:unnamed protein product [Meloidogyne enterolobii]